MKPVRTFLTFATAIALPLAAAAAADSATRPTLYTPVSGSSTAMPAISTMKAGTRMSARAGKSSSLDDTGSTIIIAAAAAVGGYFLHDIISDDDKDVVSPN